jgi:hypothetical protein
VASSKELDRSLLWRSWRRWQSNGACIDQPKHGGWAISKRATPWPPSYTRVGPLEPTSERSSREHVFGFSRASSPSRLSSVRPELTLEVGCSH